MKNLILAIMMAGSVSAQTFDFECFEYPSIINENIHYYTVNNNHQYSYVDEIVYSFQACPGLIAYQSSLDFGNVEYVSHKIIWQVKWGPTNPVPIYSQHKISWQNDSAGCEYANQTFQKKYSYYVRFILQTKYTYNGINLTHSVYSDDIFLPVIN